MQAPSDILLSADRIQKRVGELGREIRRDFPDDLLLVAVLKGSFVFAADLVRQIPGDVALDFIAVSSYTDHPVTSGHIRLFKDLDVSIARRDVVIVEDIVDTGLTVKHLQEMLRTRGPRRLATACLLSKPSRRRVDVRVDYVGFDIEDQFVVGYGLDHAEHYRNLPYIAIL